MFWQIMSKHIEHIYYINLDKRTDRKELIETELTAFDISFERFRAIENERGFVGCAYSHLEVLKLAKEREHKNILILEDDFTFLVGKEEFEREIDAFFTCFPDFDVCMLSYWVFQHYELGEDHNVNRIIEAQTASGYLVNYHYYDTLIDLLETFNVLLDETGEHWNFANDQIWKILQPKDKWFYFKKRIGKQRSGWSDLAQEEVIRDV
jgi:glycosyl transferase family 25